MYAGRSARYHEIFADEFITLVGGRRWRRASPATGNLVLLADTSLVDEPDFYRVSVERLRAREGQTGCS